MFDFLDADWFNITLEVVFLLFIAYDAKRYFETRKREYVFNIVLTIGFFIYTAIPFYNKYVTWSDADKAVLLNTCISEENNTTLCECLDDKIVKEYRYESYSALSKEDKDYAEFLDDSRKECRE
jgi:hypothetical protein